MAMAPHQEQAMHQHDHQHVVAHRWEPNDRHTDPSAAATNPWGDPYSRAMALVLLAPLIGVALIRALEAAVRYVRARRGRSGSVEVPLTPPPPPPLVYSAATTRLAGTAAECVICLSEFADGDAVRVMPACRHGFHAPCIECWLAAAGRRRSSCPTCRAPAAVATATGAAAAAQPPDKEAAASSS